MHPTTLSLVCVFALATAATAQFTHQITYIDADCATNTTLANGSTYVPQSSTSSTDNEWALRAFANGGTILSSHDGGGNEDAPMLRTVISGLIPTLPYYVYAYFWSDTANWRGRALVSATMPNPPLPGYNTNHFSTSVFAPMQPLALGSYVGYQQVSLDLAFDAAGFEISGHFAQPVLISEGNRFLFETWLGVYAADQNGEIQVYIDDLEGTQPSGNRTWYDGVGYEIAPLAGGPGCGTSLPALGYVGAPIMGTPFTSTVSGAPSSSLALCLIGFDNASWNGIPLPFDLGAFGFPGCQLQTSDDITVIAFTDPAGAASYSVNIPALAAPISIYWQWGVLDAARNLFATGTMETVFHR